MYGLKQTIYVRAGNQSIRIHITYQKQGYIAVYSTLVNLKRAVNEGMPLGERLSDKLLLWNRDL